MFARLIFGATACLLLVATSARAQSAPAPAAAANAPDRRWAVEASVGWDNSIGGNVFSSAIGVLSGFPVVIRNSTYGDVYGTGVQWRFGAGYMLDEQQEVRGAITIQNVSADVVEVGTLSAAPLFATFSDYQSVSLDGGYRYHFATSYKQVHPYAGATLGIAVIDRINGAFAAPNIGFTAASTDFYDGTAAFTFGIEGGVLFPLNDRVDLNANLGFRHVSGLSKVDAFRGTGLEDINNDSGRWTLPIMFGARFKF
jgi:hypothetical protein